MLEELKEQKRRQENIISYFTDQLEDYENMIGISPKFSNYKLYIKQCKRYIEQAKKEIEKIDTEMQAYKRQ